MVPPNLQKTVLQNNTPGLYATFEFLPHADLRIGGWTC